MDHWIAGFQGLGLAMACGALLGGVGLRGRAAWVLGVVAAVAGAYLFGLSLTKDFGVAEIADSGHPAWPGWIAGAVFAAFSYYAWLAVATGARKRAGQAVLGVSLFIGLFALVVAGLSLFVPFIGAAMFLFTAWIWFGRRRRDSQKHQGLRVLK